MANRVGCRIKRKFIMKAVHLASLAAAILAGALPARAQAQVSLQALTTPVAGPYLELSSAGLAGGTVATLSGGTVYTSHHPAFAAMTAGLADGDAFLAAGMTSGRAATLTFANGGVSAVGFLWGSPDTYNRLRVTTTGGASTLFGASTMLFGRVDGDQSFAQTVRLMADPGFAITTLTFDNLPNNDAFEVGNFIVAQVPEPQAYAMFLAGLAVVGFVGIRRKR